MFKCLVTGGAGFIGSHVADLLIAEGHDVTIVDNLSSGKIENLPSKAVFINHDIEDEELWDELEKFDMVFHLAAFARISPSIQNPKLSHNSNLNGTLNNEILFSGIYNSHCTSFFC
jgi:UDP-glucose 4-epimerase